MPQGQENQEKSGKTKKMRKVIEKWVFLKKSQEKSGNLKIIQILSVQIYKIPKFPKPSNSKKLIKNPLKSD